MAGRDAELALSPLQRWGSVLPAWRPGRAAGVSVLLVVMVSDPDSARHQVCAGAMSKG